MKSHMRTASRCSTRLLSVLLALFSLACGGAEDTSTESPSEPPPAPLVQAPSYDVHEWGLIDYVLYDGHFELAAGPGQPSLAQPAPAPVRPEPLPPLPVHPHPPRPHPPRPQPPRPHPPGPQPPSIHRPDVTIRKPVLYFHLSEGAESLVFNLQATVGAGSIIEHWPLTTPIDSGVRWADVMLSAGSCSAENYPTRSDEVCQNVPDGYCEVADLSGYEADDADCLRVAGQRYNHLFYRAGGPHGRPLPLEVNRAADGSVVVANRAMDGGHGPLLRIVRDGTRTLMAQAMLPARGAEVILPAPTALNDADPAAQRRAVAAFSQSLRDQGLTEAEAGAFERAWMQELFHNGDTGGAPVVQDALLFFLPRADIEAWAQLELTPTPTEVVRVMAVRVDLGAPANTTPADREVRR